MAAAKILDYCHTTWLRKTIKRRSISLHPRQNGGRSGTVDTFKVRLSKYMEFGYRDTCGRKRGKAFTPERNFFGHSLAGLLWERQFEKVLIENGQWERACVVSAYLRTAKWDYFYPCTGMALEWQEKSTTWNPCRKDG